MSSTPWEDVCKSWFRADPQALIDLLYGGEARYCYERPVKLESEVYNVDALIEAEIEVNGERLLVHFEFQTYYDKDMPERLLGYNVNARLKYGLAVVSVVIHLLGDTPIAPSPLRWHVPVQGQKTEQVLEFAYHVVEVGKKTVEEIWASGHTILLPFLPLAKGGRKREVIERMSETLMEQGLKEWQAVGLAFAALKLRKNKKELAWLQRRFFKMMQDVLRDSPFIQWFIDAGREEGKKKGLEEGRAEGREEGKKKGLEEGKKKGREEARRAYLQAQQQAVRQLVDLRFPALKELARERVARSEEPEELVQMMVKLGVAQSEEEAQQVLLDTQPGQKPVQFS